MQAKLKTLTLLPPAPGRCVECANIHDAAEPHNQRSLYYQVKFYQQHGRIPTWDDAMAHCQPEVQTAWREHLQEPARKDNDAS